MSEKRKFLDYSAVTYLTLFVAIVVVAGLAGSLGRIVDFIPMDGQDVFDVLVPLVLIGLFIERTVEVLVRSWRGFGREKLDKALEKAKLAGDTDAVDVAETELQDYRTETLRFAFLCAGSLALFVSVVGVRTLEHLTDIERAATLWHEETGNWVWQTAGFRMADVIITTGMLAGGASGIHKVLSLFLDFVDGSRARLTTSGSSSS